ncbi:hypothetical protein K458DRAFT_383057 [Lentithecium fluviatile CBS 122367]|uniref:Secreted protein n=1 Tax=Lentithecium fluviatile CBS 122367 TaxID=1168545 RepID=A0A6G1JI80_9PLEO|nr:hypothetical protein K458DRAFT_383057 [Lentithecium fluviatile CBS 122367]
MRSIILSLAVSMAMTHQAVAFTYWIDGTCTGHKSMDATLAEVIAMGKGVNKRLNSASDTDFQHVWEYAIKRTKDTNDNVFKDVSGFMRDVGAMTQENNRNKANVRIYCDDEEKRWKERVNPNTGRKLGG